MASVTTLNPTVTVDVAQTGYLVEALDARRPQAGLTCTVRVIHGATVHKSDTLVLADEAGRHAYAQSALSRIDPTTPGAPTVPDLEAALVDLQTAVEVALRGPTGGAGVAGAPAGPQNPLILQIPYKVEDRCTIWMKPIHGGLQRVPLANFAATITGERVVDEGANEPRTEFEIAADLAGGGGLRTLTVPAGRSPAMTWVAEG